MRTKHYLPLLHKFFQFRTEWNIPFPYYPTGENFTLPLITGYDYNFYVNWGDGSPVEHYIYGTEEIPDAVHAYLSANTYQISIWGLCQRFSVDYFGHPPSERNYLTKVLQWGSIGLVSCNSMFDGCENLISIPGSDIWPGIVDFSRCFYGNESLLGNAPLLWLRVPEPSGIDCFYGDIGLTNYPSIPNDWKGL